jgi:hypothetical protein
MREWIGLNETFTLFKYLVRTLLLCNNILQAALSFKEGITQSSFLIRYFHSRDNINGLSGTKATLSFKEGIPDSSFKIRYFHSRSALGGGF